MDNKLEEENVQSEAPLSVEPAPADEIPKKSNLLKIIIYVSAVLVFIAGGFWFYQNRGSFIKSTPKPSPTTGPQPTGAPITDNQLSASHNRFGFKLLKQIQEEEGNGNIVVSPSSVALALSMVYNGADEETKEAMAETLGIQGIDVNDVNRQSAALMSDLSNPDPKVEIAIANSIWGKEGLTFNPNFLQANEQYYQAEIDYLDFSKPNAVNIINSWVNENTRGKIPTVLSPPLDPLAVMYLINAIYFNGTWTAEFDKELTQDRQFTFEDGSQKMHSMMEQYREDFMYFENDLFQAVDLPYGENKRLKMSVFLPKRSLAEFAGQLNFDNWDLWMAEFRETEGTVILPRFKIEYEKTLNGSLSSLGMEVVFNPSRANFTKIAPAIFISEVIHKTFIEVNEEGTEAAAVTAITMSEGSVASDKKVFYMEINKPFFFAIHDDQTGEILFMGFVQEPK